MHAYTLHSLLMQEGQALQCCEGGELERVNQDATLSNMVDSASFTKALVSLDMVLPVKLSLDILVG